MIEKEFNIFYSKKESVRFNANVFRGNLDEIDFDKIDDFIIKNSVDFLIFRIATENLNKFEARLTKRFPHIIADTLVYYKSYLDNIKEKSFKNSNIQFIKCLSSDKSLLENMVEIIFQNYKNHYYSNPLIEKKFIIEGYKEWVADYLNSKNKIVFKVSIENKIAAFMTCSFDDNRECEGVLYGVLPEFSGRRIYTDMIRFSQNYFKERNFKILKVSTQSHNYAVQKAWINEGFYLFSSFNTIHINSLMNISYKKKLQYLIKENNNKWEIFDEFVKTTMDNLDLQRIGDFIEANLQSQNPKLIPKNLKKMKWNFINSIESSNSIEISFPTEVSQETIIILIKIRNKEQKLNVFGYYFYNV